jgi:flagellar hook-associated protein 2
MSAVSGLSSGSLNSLLNSLQPSSSSSASSTPSLNAPALTVGGLATGLNTDQIIQGLLAPQQAQVTLLQQNQQKVTGQETAFKTIESQLLTLQGSVGKLAASFNGAFDARTVTSSTPTAVTAAASSNVTPGVYTLQVNSLARAEQIASQGFDSASSTITQGTLQLRVGTGPTTTVTIDSTNNTLQGLVNAINNANGGVTASLVNDGSGPGNQPYRLLLTANQSGAANTITVTSNLGASGGGAIQPDFTSNFVGPTDLGTSYTGTATPTANTGAGGYTGAANNTYTFTVVNSGTVGTDNNLQVSYTDSTGANTGTITLNSSDAGVAKNVAQGIQVQFAAGTLVAGQTFTVKAYTPVVQQAANAAVTLGSGSGALTVQSPTNQMNNLINGVTLQLQATTTQPVTLTVANDTSSAQKAIQDFVQAYNGVADAIKTQSSYDAQTGIAGPLLGNGDLLQVQNQLSEALGGAINGANPLMNNLSNLGITFNDQGDLQVDQTKLTNALSGQVSGVSFNDIRNLFALAGNSDNAGVQFITGSAKTKASATPYQVQLTRAATQASATGTNPLAASTVITAANNSFTITIDGVTSKPITLTAGTYSSQALAQEVQAEINGSSSLVGRQVAVSMNGNQLSITSSTYGAASQVKIGTGTALAALGFTGTEAAQGQDVAGSFLVNGVTEAAKGTGQFLQGLTTNSNTADLMVRVTLSGSQIPSGPAAKLTVSRGIGAQVNDAVQQMLDPATGRFKLITDNLDAEVQDIQKQINQQNALIQAQHDQLVTEYANLESTVSQLQTVGNFLTAQTNSLVGNGQSQPKIG